MRITLKAWVSVFLSPIFYFLYNGKCSGTVDDGDNGIARVE